MSYKFLKVERNGHVAIVTLNRPEKGNALSTDLMNEIIDVSEGFRDDLKTRVVLFTGAGKNFTYGMDLHDKKDAARADTLLEKQRRFSVGPRMIRKLTEINQITIAAVNGYALGGGACIASALDFRIGADDCRIGYPEVNLGIPLSWISLPLCVHLVGPARAKRMVILGRKEDAQTLLGWGFLDEVVKKEDLMEKALEMANQYAGQAPIAAQMIKRSINAITCALDQSIMHMDSDQVLLSQKTEDFIEGIQSTVQKRTPDFKGK
jgi:enoyl-CoA hydratase/carnithine racemase